MCSSDLSGVRSFSAQHGGCCRNKVGLVLPRPQQPVTVASRTGAVVRTTGLFSDSWSPWQPLSSQYCYLRRGWRRSWGSTCPTCARGAEQLCNRTASSGWDLNPLSLRPHTWSQDLVKFRFLMSQPRRNSARGKVIGKKWIYLGDSLVVHWVKDSMLPVRGGGAWVRSLVREPDPTSMPQLRSPHAIAKDPTCLN